MPTPLDLPTPGDLATLDLWGTDVNVAITAVRDAADTARSVADSGVAAAAAAQSAANAAGTAAAAAQSAANAAAAAAVTVQGRAAAFALVFGG